jgi:hydroxymethylpyrimidine pyrophosphatase-like HAD family hydrolase
VRRCYGRGVLRALYVDLDGTLLGPGGSLFSSPAGFTLDGARALQACHRAGIEVVIYTGRKQPGVWETMRLIGQHSYIFELGCGLVIDGELQWLTGDCVPSPERGTIFDQIAASGAPAVLLEAFAGRFEYHQPWSDGREVSHLFRGEISAAEANEVLSGAGFDWLRLVDNGVVGQHGRPIDQSTWGIRVERVHAYHLIPAVASKATAVARHMQNRGYVRGETIACGDSREDLEAAAVVGTFWMMANGVSSDPTISADLAVWPNVRVSSGEFGAGVYEAVVSTLAEGS